MTSIPAYVHSKSTRTEETLKARFAVFLSLSLSPPPAGGGAPPKLHNNSLLLLYCRAVAKALGKSKAKTEKGEGKWRLQSKTWERASSTVFSFSCTRPSIRPSVRRRSEGVRSSDHRVNLREQLPRRGRRGKTALVFFFWRIVF